MVAPAAGIAVAGAGEPGGRSGGRSGRRPRGGHRDRCGGGPQLCGRNRVSGVAAGCAYNPYRGATYYTCNGAWFQPAYGANGMYYTVVPVP